ncbi:MAG: beta-lactamase family protein [Flavobacteriaceae bacterium]|nr:beta-lactamase family protein [Flavobacteriaceae bacterium]
MNKILVALFFLMGGTLTAQESTAQGELSSSLDSLVQAQLSKNKIPSLAVGIVKDGDVVFEKGYGYANVEDKVPANEHTVYQVGSVTKMFTGHLLATLITEGNIQLTDTLSHYFESSLAFPKTRRGQVVTIMDMATHSSGFPRYPRNLKRKDPHPIKGYTLEEMHQGIERVRLKKEIGVTYSYSNFGYGILGVAMENRMETPFSQLLTERVLKKYNMHSSSLMYEDRFKDRLAIPYLETEPLVRTEPWDMGTLSGAGNLFSTVSDLNQFMIGFMENTEVNRIQQTPYFKINEEWSYGLGCFVIDSKKRNTLVIYHGGDIDGYAAFLMVYTEPKLGIVILTNWGEGSAIGAAFDVISKAIVDFYLSP